MRQIIDGRLTPARKYNLSRDRVKRWPYYYRRGLKRGSVQGRPRALDREGLQSVQDWLDEDVGDVNDVD